MWESTTKHVPFECCSSALPQQCLLDIKTTMHGNTKRW